MTKYSTVRRSSGVGVLALLALTAAVPGAFAQGAPAASEAPSKIPVLTRAQIDDYLKQPDKVLIIDVRRPDEVSDIGGFPAYLSIQISDLERFLPVIPKDRQLIVVSNHAGRGQKGAELLAAKGLNVVGAAGAESYEKEGGNVWLKKAVTPEIRGVVKAGTPIGVVGNGFSGTEGPAVLADGSVLFVENRADRVIRVDPKGGTSVYLEKDGGANALAINAKGELLGIETAEGATGVAVLQPQHKLIVTGYNGKPFVRPNDLALSSHGDIYLSDPGAAQKAAAGEAVKTGVYWVNAHGKVTLVADDLAFPNGVALSADEKTLFVADTQGPALLAFTVNANGSLSDRREFARLAGYQQTAKGGRSGADGIAVDKQGRVYVATNAGVEVFEESGNPLGVIALPRQPQNLVFGGKDHATLYVVGRGTVYRIPTLANGPDRIGK